jgi:xylulokinase
MGGFANTIGVLDNIRLVAAQGIPVSSAAISGGAASSPVWRQLMADIMSIPLYTVNAPEGAAFGAALLAAVGTGEWPDVPSACAEVVRRVDAIVPEPDGVAAYERLYPIFRNLYPELRPTFEHLADFEASSLLESEP